MMVIEGEEKRKIIECFIANKCKSPIEHIRQNKNTKEFKVVRACAEQKCPAQFAKVKPFLEAQLAKA